MILNKFKILTMFITLCSLLELCSCTAIPTQIPVPTLPTSITECSTQPMTFNTNEDLIYNLYQLKHDYNDCKIKHDTVIQYYNNVRNSK